VDRVTTVARVTGATRATLRPRCLRWALGAAAFASTLAAADEPVSPAVPAELSGRAVEVGSGDSLVVEYGGRRVDVRLADINAPQGSDYYAPAAKTLLANIVLDQPVRVAVAGVAADGTVFGYLTFGELDVNLEMVKRGAAWPCWDFAQRTDFLHWEYEARRWRRGLWVATWEIDARAACLRRPPVATPPARP
jgi:endonuclease YncB( thermonuclease family)